MIEALSSKELLHKESSKPLSILLLGDASNYHQALATGLRRLGHQVALASDGSRWMNTERDIDLSRPYPGKLGGLALWLKIRGRLMRRFSGHDVVAINTSSFLPLKPSRQRWLFDAVRGRNRSVFYNAVGTDPGFVAECLRPETPLRYNDYRIYGKPSPYSMLHPENEKEWLSSALKGLYDHVIENVDGAVGCLWEYNVSLEKVLPREKIFAGAIPIDTRSIEPVELPDKIERVRLFLGRHNDRMVLKGTDILELAAREVVDRYPDKAELVVVENRPYAEYLELLKSAHVVLDQIYSYTPATNALLAMAMGLNTVSGGSEEYYNHIGEQTLRPVIHVEPDYELVYRALEHTVLHPEMIKPRGLQGRELVEKYNACEKVAADNVDFWLRRVNQCRV